MKLNTPAKLYNCLKYEMPEIFLDEEVMERAGRPIWRMLGMMG
jgi:quinolinate synthase